jgi:hypothetical protein
LYSFIFRRVSAVCSRPRFAALILARYSTDSGRALWRDRHLNRFTQAALAALYGVRTLTIHRVCAGHSCPGVVPAYPPDKGPDDPL